MKNINSIKTVCFVLGVVFTGRRAAFAWLAGAGLLLAGCSTEELVSPPDPGSGTDGRNVEIVLEIPGATVPTKAIDENGVRTLDVLVFDVAANGEETFAEYKEGASLGPYVAEDIYRIKFTAPLTAGNDKRVAVIANIRNVVAPLFTGASPRYTAGALKTDILKDLIATTADFGGYIPMYGETAKLNISPGMKIDDTHNGGLKLIRMAASVEIMNNIPEFQVTRMWMYHYPAKGYVAPQWNASTGRVDMNVATQPNINEVASGWFSAFESGSIMTSPSYMLENKVRSTSQSSNNNTCLVIGGKILSGPHATSEEQFYRVDFTYDGTTGEQKGELMPILRNHKYLVSLDKLEGRGYASEAEAVRTYTVISNLRAHTIYYDQSVLQNINFNGQNMLGVQDAELTFDWIGRPQKNQVVTDYEYSGWKVLGVTDSPVAGAGSTVNWLSCKTETAATTRLKDNLIIEPMVNLDPQSVHPERVAYIHLKAGRLTHMIKVTQTPAPDEVNSYKTHLSNTYIVRPGSKPMLIPVAQANNADMMTIRRQIAAADVLTGNMVWTDSPKGMSPDGPVEFVKGAANTYTGGTMGSNGYLLVVPGCVEGNAVGEIRTSGGSKWAWLIWTTDYNPDVAASRRVNQNNGVRFMDRHLGALVNNAAAANADYSNTGLWYWHSYHIPLAKHMYNADGSAFSMSNFPWYYTTDWSIYANFGWWGYPKTGFDPCPKGWQVPSFSNFSGLSTANRGTFYKGYTWDGAIAGQPAIGYFPASGEGDPFYDVGVVGACWVIEHDGDICGSGVSFDSEEVCFEFLGYDGDVDPVRCVQYPPT